MEQTSLNIGTIGQKLASARNAKGVTVSEAGQATKILSKFIEAMESDDFGALSAPVYAKSFIKMYAEYLGLDARPLVDEYVAQHAPKTKPQLSDEVRQKLASTDQMVAGETAAAPEGEGDGVFSGVNEAISGLSGSGFSLKVICSAVGAVLLLVGLVVFGVKACAGEDEEPVAAGGAASVVEREVIADGVPDAYMVKPGEVEVER